MRKNEEWIAVYSRKSKFTGKGESIGNQVELCKEYVRNMFGDEYVDRADGDQSCEYLFFRVHFTPGICSAVDTARC